MPAIDACRRAAHDALATGRTYVEGYAVLADGVPVEHAWTVDEHGIVFDAVLGTEAAVGGYWGVPVPTPILTRALVEKRSYGVLRTRAAKQGIISQEKKAIKVNTSAALLKIADDLDNHGFPFAVDVRALAIKLAELPFVPFERLALDRASVREIDQDGRLDVEITNISAARVNPYIGREIPGAEELGLDPGRIYQLLRDPKELAKAAPSFCNLPVLSQHVPVFAEDYADQAKKYVVGTTGSDCVFEAPFLRCSLKIWDGDAIRAIVSGEQKELSCGYHYKPVMKPGIYESEKYDGVMTAIVGNHVALVREGRAGADVVVGDSKENLKMAKKPMTRTAAIAIGVLAPYVRSKLAADKGIDLRPILCGLTAEDLRDRKPAVAAALKKACRGKLARDTSLGEVAEFLDMLEAHGGEIDDADEAVDPGIQKSMENTAVLEPQETPGLEPGQEAGQPGIEPAGKPAPKGPNGAEIAKPAGPVDEDEGDNEELKAFLRGKLSEEDFARVCEMMGIGSASVEADEGEPNAKGEEQLEKLGAAHEGAAEDPEDAVRKGEAATDEEHEEKEDHMTAKDQPPAFKGNPTPGGKVSGDRKYITQDEMEKALRAAAEAERKIQRDIRDAERIVQPWVGNLAMAFDSDEQVYRKALKMLGVPGVDRVHASALRTILEMQPKPGAKPRLAARVAADESVQVGSFLDRYPDAGRIRLT
jgi:hypothetical protein